jgi:hypothetical protein
VILEVKRGIRVLRLPQGSEEVKIKRHWMSQNEDGTWEPRFGYNPMDKRRSVPVTVARWNPDTSRWEGDNANWRQNPIDRWIATLSEEDRRTKYAQELFYLNVIDLTPVRIDTDGEIHYPDDTMKYPTAPATAKKGVVGKMRILSGSSGDPNGKSMYANLTRLAKGALDEDGESLSIYDYDIRLMVTGQGRDSVKSFNMGAVRPLAEEYAGLPKFDFRTWPPIWPNAAIEELMNGGDYSSVIDTYNLKVYPDLEGASAAVSSGNEEEEEF